MKPQTDEEMLAAARSLCRPNGLFIKERGQGEYHVYRCAPAHPIHLGFRTRADELLRFIERLVAHK